MYNVTVMPSRTMCKGQGKGIKMNNEFGWKLLWEMPTKIHEIHKIHKYIR